MGSFFNVCIYRIPRKESIVFPPSHCPKCGTSLKFYDNIPIASYILLRGRCRYCKEKISPLYPLVELLTGVLYVGVFIYYGSDLLSFFTFLVFISFLIVISFIDLEHMIIPNILVLPGIFVGLLFSFMRGEYFFLDSLCGLLTGGVIIFLIVFLSKGGMGEGDIKLSAMIGSFLGVKLTVIALLLSFIVGGIVGIVLLTLKIKGRKDPIPFGPFLTLGAVLSLMWGQVIAKMWGWY